MGPTSTFAHILPRETDTQPAGQKNSSLFTFLIALLILFFASSALVLRTVLRRRRLRNGVHAALDAGILLPQLPALKPKLSEVWVRLVNDIRDWDALMPLCATVVPEKDSVDSNNKLKARTPVEYHLSPARRFMEVLSHRHAVTDSQESQPPERDALPSQPSNVQVTVLIAMPTEQHFIPPHDSPDSPKGKRRDSVVNHDDGDPEDVPDVMFGVSTLTWSRTDSHDL